MFSQTPSNPFEEELLPKAHYFPSLKRDLSSSQKKTCFSPIKGSDHQRQSSKTDEKFLRESNKLEIPTREDGTSQHELSSGSQFNESWPSTDRNVSSLSQNTPSSSTTPAEKESHSVKTTHKNINEDSLSHPSTLSRYIERFRHGTPRRREDRSLTSSTKDFWWLSPPSNTSTPKETSDSTTSKFTSQSSAKISRNTTTTSPPRQKYGFKRNQFSRPVREAVTAKDSRTTDLLTRTNELLEKSENTLSEDSSESIPKPPSSWMIEKQKRLNDVGCKSTDIKPRLAPEDDILYQWRLARRLEKAQKEAKGGQGKHFGNTESHRPVTFTHDRSCLQEKDHPRCYMNSEGRKDDFKARENKTFKRISKIPDRSLQDDKVVDQVMNGVISKSRRSNSVRQERESIKCTERNKLAITRKNAANNSVALESNVPAVCFIDEEKLPSHVHMLCDIVPCSKQEGRGVDDENDFSAADFKKHNIERGQKNRTEFDSTNVQYHDSFRERPVMHVNGVTEAHKTRQLPSVSSNPDLTETEKERTEYSSPRPSRKSSKHEKSEKEVIPKIIQPPVTHAELKKAESNSASHTVSSLESKKYDQNELNYHENCKVDTVCEKTMKELDANKLMKKARQNEDKREPRKSVESSDVANLIINTSTPMVSGHDVHQKTGLGDQTTDLQTEGVIDTVIGQVISQRLFSSMSASRRSSMTSSSSSTECEDDDDKKEHNMLPTSEECATAQKSKTETSDKILFPDDDILIRLRQKADFYREHLRNINMILEQSTEWNGWIVYSNRTDG